MTLRNEFQRRSKHAAKTKAHKLAEILLSLSLSPSLSAYFPICSQATLVLHRCDNAFAAPIHAFRFGFGAVQLECIECLEGRLVFSCPDCAELFFRPVRELIHSHVPRVQAWLVFCIVGSDLFQVGLKYSLPLRSFSCSIGLGKLWAKLLKAVILVSAGLATAADLWNASLWWGTAFEGGRCNLATRQPFFAGASPTLLACGAGAIMSCGYCKEG